MSLEEKLSNQIVEVILKYKKPEKIIIFGSRARDDFEYVSDIDIAIFGKDWTDKDMNIAKDRLNEGINTPLKFDVIDFYSIVKETLRENILKDGLVIYESREN